MSCRTVRARQHRKKPWEERLNELAIYREKNDTCNVPQSQGALGKWVHKQRESYKKGKLSQERTTQLEGIAFNWGTRKQKSDAEQWEERLNELAIYREKNDNCNVPQSQGALGRWVRAQRESYKKGKLSQERTTQLEGIAFNWGTRKQWEERFNELVVYKEKNGTCNVPRSQGALGNWVMDQRQLWKKGKLSQDHSTQLEDIGFNWGARKHKSDAEQWEERFNELVVYNEKNGNYNVPQRHSALGKWVSRQRHFYKKGKLSRERATQLEGIGFIRKLKRGSTKPSTQVQSESLTAGKSDEEEDVDSKTNTLSSGSPVEISGTAICNHPNCTNKDDVAKGRLPVRKVEVMGSTNVKLRRQTRSASARTTRLTSNDEQEFCLPSSIDRNMDVIEQTRSSSSARTSRHLRRESLRGITSNRRSEIYSPVSGVSNAYGAGHTRSWASTGAVTSSAHHYPYDTDEEEELGAAIYQSSNTAKEMLELEAAMQET